MSDFGRKRNGRFRAPASSCHEDATFRRAYVPPFAAAKRPVSRMLKHQPRRWPWKTHAVRQGMRKRALSFARPSVRPSAPGRRYIYGHVALGALEEGFWSSTDVWTAAQYERHWQMAARRCLARHKPALFYTDVRARSAMVYHAVPTARGLLIFQHTVARPQQPIAIEGLARGLVRDRKRISCWTASMTSLHSLATGR